MYFEQNLEISNIFLKNKIFFQLCIRKIVAYVLIIDVFETLMSACLLKHMRIEIIGR